VQRARGGGRWRTIASPTTRSYTVTGLTNGMRYTFRIRAQNTLGWGPFSTVVNAVPRTVPTEPQWPSAIRGNASVTLYWGAPASDGGAATDNYRVEYATNAGGPWTQFATTAAAPYTAPGLTNGTTYYFRFRAHNAAGWSAPSTVVNATPITVPAAPLMYEAKPGNGTLELKWLEPHNGGSPINGYYVQKAASPGGPWMAVVNTTLLSYKATELTNGTTYYYRIVAHNAAGASTPSAVQAVTPLTVPGVPVTCSGHQLNGPGSHTMQIDWSPPAATGGAPISSYTVDVFTIWPLPSSSRKP
jgi:predicted phage tail protein